jgi:hypothetical protein
MKRIVDIKKFKSTLPYSSEIFGVYQPMLGWGLVHKLGQDLGSTSNVTVF